MLRREHGPGQIPEAITKLKNRIKDLKERAAGVVKTVARAKLEGGFAYEYRRVSTEAVIFQARLTQAGLQTHHPALVWGRLDGALAATSDVTIESYLNEKSVKRSESWGFTLGLHKWKISGSDNKSLASVERTSLEGVQRSYIGSRGYEAKWIGRDWSWEVDFNADMPAFSASPRVSEFGFGVSEPGRRSSAVEESLQGGISAGGKDKARGGDVPR